jgi:hypothetical protein
MTYVESGLVPVYQLVRAVLRYGGTLIDLDRIDGLGYRRRRRLRAYSTLIQHISPDGLRSYVLGQTSPAEGDRIVQHLAVCEPCRQAGTKAGVIAVHVTDDGPVVLTIGKVRSGWVGRVRGTNLDGGSAVGSRAVAISWCHTSFRQMFPEHQCSDQCLILISSASQ